LVHTAVFKPAGFTRVRHTFSRKEDGYLVAFQFQGSDWNDSTRPWTFYLNAGIQFSDIPRRTPDRDFPTIHTWIRVSYMLANDALPSYQVDEDHLDLLVERIRSIVHDVRTYFGTRHQFIRERYLERPQAFLVYLDESLMKKSETSS
jgi:hypothetical protein